jgi:hypothetical protein
MSTHMPYPEDDRPSVDEQIAGGSCPYCGQAIADPLAELDLKD